MAIVFAWFWSVAELAQAVFIKRVINFLVNIVFFRQLQQMLASVSSLPENSR